MPIEEPQREHQLARFRIILTITEVIEGCDTIKLKGMEELEMVEQEWNSSVYDNSLTYDKI